MIKEFQGDYRWLSNFAIQAIIFEGKSYPATENAYQAAKTVIDAERVQFETMTPGQAKRTGKIVTMRSDWDSVKLSIMEEVTRKKYQHDPFKSKLLETGDKEIQEGNTWNDTFWGICNGEGENNLGKIIMKIRGELQATQSDQELLPENPRNEKIIKSSNIYKIEWDENNLWVHYNNESVYQYKDVPENVSIKMGEAESAGSFLHQNIKGKYRYERIN